MTFRFFSLLRPALLTCAVVAASLGSSHWQAGQPLLNTAAAADAGVAALWKAQLTDPAGHPATLPNWQGQTVVVNFWASWCGPCVREMPELDKLSRAYAKKGIHFVGIGVDSTQNVTQFLGKTKVSYPILVSGYGGADLARALGNSMGGLPFTIVIDKQGKIRSTRLGEIRPNELAHTLDTL